MDEGLGSGVYVGRKVRALRDVAEGRRRAWERLRTLSLALGSSRGMSRRLGQAARRR
jgi:hypothetical protein